MLTDQEKDQLFEANVKELNKMDIGAGSLVKALIKELEDRERNTYIRLHDADPGGFVIMYDLAQGSADKVLSVGRSLRFKSVSASRLEVFSA